MDGFRVKVVIQVLKNALVLHDYPLCKLHPTALLQERGFLLR